MKEIFIEKLLRIIVQQKNKMDGVELAVADVFRLITNIAIQIIKESDKKNG